MKISELIKELEIFKDEYGDLEVYTISSEDGFVEIAEYLSLIKKWDGMVTDKGCMIRY